MLLFAVILAGGVVRSSGSGMGCPDWPRCFGRFIPPTNSGQLPKDYKEKYVGERSKKNQRFAKTLDFFGFGDLASRIRNDKSILVPEEFNVTKTWTEYVNRLVGVIAGIFMILIIFFSFSYSKENPAIPALCILNLILVGFQGWLGSIVVSTNLVPWIVTVHMLLALAILAICIGTYQMARVYDKHKLHLGVFIRVIAFAALLISVVQIVFGTELRQRIDAVSAHFQGGYRSEWINDAGAIFITHRESAIAVIVVNIILYVLVRRVFSRHSIQQQTMSFIFLMIMLQIVTGIILSYWALPPYAQAIHIVLASIVFGAQFYLLMNLYRSEKRQEVYQ